MSVNLILMGSASDTISLPNATVFRFDGGTPAEFQLAADGYRYHRFSGVLTRIGPWVVPLVNAQYYECRATLLSGVLTGGTTNTWLPLNTNQSWTRGAALQSSQYCSFSLEIRRAGGGNTLKTATIELTCDRTNG